MTKKAKQTLEAMTKKAKQTLEAMTGDDMRIMDQLEELRGCDKRLTACMLDRLGDLRR